jgi:hypothetical protein
MADEQLTQLNSASLPLASTDLFYIVQQVTSTGTSRKITFVDLSGQMGGGSGNVVGPVSAVNGNLAVFDGTTGKIIKDGGSPSGGASLINELHIAQIAVMRSTAGTAGANITAGVRFQANANCSLTGISVGWNAGSVTLDIGVWDLGTDGLGTTALSTSETMAVTGGPTVITHNFASPISLVSGHYYSIGIYDQAGAVFANCGLTPQGALYPAGLLTYTDYNAYHSGSFALPNTYGGTHFTCLQPEVT